MGKFSKTVLILTTISIILFGTNIYQWMENKKLTIKGEELATTIGSLLQKNKETEEQKNKLIEEKEELEFIKEELEGTISKFIDSKQYTNEKYSFAIKHFTDQVPYTHDWEKNRHPNMPRRLWDASFFDSRYGMTSDGKTGIPSIDMTVSQCLPQEDIESCLPLVTSPCGTVPYGEIKKAYGDDAVFEVNPGPDFVDFPSKKLKIVCMAGEEEEGVAILRNSRLYTILFLTSSKDHKPVPKTMGELMLSTFRFLE